MNRESRYQTQNRKRNIQQTSLKNSEEVQAKQRKYNNSKSNMSTDTPNFTDLSGTINTRTRATPSANIANVSTNRIIDSIEDPSTSVPNVRIYPDVRELVVDETLTVERELEERVKKIVQVEVSGIRKSIEELTIVIGELSRAGSRIHESVNSHQGLQNTASGNNIDFGNRNGDNRFCFQGNNLQNGLNMRQTGSNMNALPMPTSGNLPNNEENIYPLGNNRATPRIHQFSNNSSGNLDKIQIRVDKWGISFDGISSHTSIEDFIFRIEHLQAHYGINWDEILRDFHLLVTGPAKDWYWLLIRTHGIMKWPTLKCELYNQYRTNTSNFEIMRDLVERKQNPNETLDTFFHMMCKLRSKLVQPIPEFDMIKILKRNVRESVARIVYPISVSSVEQLRIECIEAERNFPRRDIRNSMPIHRPVRSVNEVCFDTRVENDVDTEEIAAIKILPQNKQLVCWNCKSPGHGFRDCNSSERSLFCYRCGKANVIAPKCPDCQRENRMRDVGLIGDLRPSKNSAMEKP